MLRNRIKGIESDRFITARSVEREKKIEKYKIYEEQISEEKMNKSEFNLFENPKKEKKIKTPSIVVDEKQYSKNLYLSLLKSQIFNSGGELTRSNKEANSTTNLSKKKRKIQFQSKFGDDISDIEGGSTSLNKPYMNSPKTHEIFKKIDFSNNNIEKCYSNIGQSNKIDIENLQFSEENSKSSFRKLLNFEIDDNECTKQFLIQKRIAKSPYRILDAPNLRDDFYLHLMDWSSKDFLAVGLEKSLYIWEGKSSNVNLLNTIEDDYLTSVCWINEGNTLLVGTNSGKVNVWDVEKCKCTAIYNNHSERVGIISKMNTNNNIFSTGSQDRTILNFDLRINPCEEPINKLAFHTQEVCGLKWSHDDRLLASGGNDNKLLIWNGNKMTLEQKFISHTSAVKALDWSPHKFGYLISGGGTQDRTIKIWNTNTMKLMESIDTSSQVCNIAFSKNTHEFVTTHGYSDNLILIWNSDTLDVKATLKGHKDRVIYLSTSPDMQKIVTGAGDETIRFWEVFVPDDSSEKCVKLNNSNIEIKNYNVR